MSTQRYSVTVEETQYSVSLGLNYPIGAQFVKGGNVPVPNGSDTASVTFATVLPLGTSSYFVVASIQNTADSFPKELAVRVSGFTQSTVTFKLSDITDTGNYSINWMIGARVNG